MCKVVGSWSHGSLAGLLVAALGWYTAGTAINPFMILYNSMMLCCCLLSSMQCHLDWTYLCPTNVFTAAMNKTEFGFRLTKLDQRSGWCYSLYYTVFIRPLYHTVASSLKGTCVLLPLVLKFVCIKFWPNFHPFEVK